MRIKFLRLVLTLCLLLVSLSAWASLDINVVYPKPSDVIKANRTFLLGSTNAKTLYIDGKKVKLYSLGTFVKIVNLKEGSNKFKFQAYSQDKSEKLTYSVKRKKKRKSLPSKPLKIIESTIYPKGDILYKKGDKIRVSFQGSPGARAYFDIGNKKDIPMKEVYERVAGYKGLYKGTYTIQSSDNFKNAKITVRVKNKYARLTRHSKGVVSTLGKTHYLFARVKKNKAVVRKTPGGDRLTPLVKDTIICLDGRNGKNYRIFFSRAKKGWISKKDIEILSVNNSTLSVDLDKVNIEDDKKFTSLKIPFSQKVPFSIQQFGSNRYTLNFYGVKEDIENGEYKDEGSNIKHIQWGVRDNILRIALNTKNSWGYDYHYDNGDFVFKLKKKPRVTKDKPLKGLKIALDPGHGGNNLGAVGLTGVPEKTVNLYISTLLKKELEHKGAWVYMTRYKDVRVDLYDRVERIQDENVDIVLSIHNNALPDTKDPMKIYGAGVYYYHPQSYGLSKAIQNQLVTHTHLNDNGVHKRSFVLTRPSCPLWALVECAFMINPYDYEKLLNEDFQQEIAVAIRKGVEDFIKENLKEEE